MKFQVKSGDLEAKSGSCLVVGVFENGDLTPTAKKLDKTSQGYLSKLIKQGEMNGKVGQTLMLFNLPKISSERVLLVGCGKDHTVSLSDFRKITACAIRAVSASKATQATLYLAELAIEKRDVAFKIRHLVQVCHDTLYRFDEFKSTKAPAPTLHTITLHVDKAALRAAEKALAISIAITEGTTYTKNIANQPSNICNPSYLAQKAKELAKRYSAIKVKVLEENEMKKLGMNAFLAVAQGSKQDAKLICLEYHGASKNQAPVALVGKGITFDTGGISLKPADAMVGMKYDMCGSATVLGVMKAVAELKLPINLVGILATAENMPSGEATKPEDIVTSMSGQTIEILNTDAEGRLVLCDALTYCERYKPSTVIDIATLTGAVVIALGHQTSAVLSNHQPLADELLAAGQETYDRAWQMPLWEEYQDQLKSPFADMSNTGGRTAGTITAACFLSRFAKKFQWAHLDVAGTAAMMGGADRYATGRPVPLLMQFLLKRCHKA